MTIIVTNGSAMTTDAASEWSEWTKWSWKASMAHDKRKHYQSKLPKSSSVRRWYWIHSRTCLTFNHRQAQIINVWCNLCCHTWGFSTWIILKKYSAMTGAGLGWMMTISIFTAQTFVDAGKKAQT